MANVPDDLDMEAALITQMAIEAMVGGEPAVPDPPLAQRQQWTDETDYSEKYCDEVYEYRRVTVPRGMLQVLPQGRCMEESEWRAHGITMSRGWEHYDHHSPEANVLLFRRVLGTDPKTGYAPAEMIEKVRAREAFTTELERLRQRMVAEKVGRQDQFIQFVE
jgi:cyclin-dependent kinase regulatory subunit CKS1